jgi:glycosyltransferase involved in cell wall biosynthesis
LGRCATAEPDFTPFTQDELATYRKCVDGADIVLSLKEQPLRLTNQLEVVDVPHVACLHRSDPENQGQSLESLLQACRLGSVVMCIACADSSKMAYEKAGVSVPIHVVMNGVDLDKFKPSSEHRRSVRAELGIGQNDPMVLFAARYDGMKNVPGFFEAARIFLEANPDAQIVMCGAGMTPANPLYCQDAAHYFAGAERLWNRVRPLGIRHDMEALYAAADIVALTSDRGEAGPLCLLEGMASGAVPVSTDVGDARQMLAPDLGIVTSLDPADIAASWRLAYDNRKTYRENIAAIRHRLDRRQMISQYGRILYRIIDRSSDK